MNYKLPSGAASINSTGGALATIEYTYPQSKKDIQEALREALQQLLLMEQQINAAQDCGYFL